MNFVLRRLVLRNGRCPFNEWFESLERNDQLIVDARLVRVRVGNFGDVKHVGDGVWELRFHKGKALRLYFGRIGQNIILLISGGDKRSQKFDINKAHGLFTKFKRGELGDADT